MEVKIPETEVEHDIAFDESGNVILKKKVKVRRGRRSKARGGQFELAVRKDLELKGWIVDKWSNNVDMENEAIHPAKRKYNPFSKAMTIGTGFPDFVAFQRRENGNYKIIAVEVKTNGTLSLIEKKKCAWYLKNRIFSEILIASKTKIKNRVDVKYVDVKDILRRMR
jgi:tRNA G46 methylase TrmB